MWLDSRHDLVLRSGLHQHAVHKQQRRGEAVLGPLPPFIKADPVSHRIPVTNPASAAARKTDAPYLILVIGEGLGADQNDWLVSTEPSQSLCAISYCSFE